MDEELIVSGRHIPNIDPYLHVWHWQIPLYLFLGGLAAGILFFAGYFVVTGKQEKMKATVKWAPIIAPFVLVIGLTALFWDLKHKLYFWQLYTTVRFESPMSWGAWTLMIITPLSVLWVASYLKEIIPTWDWKVVWFNRFESWLIKIRVPMAWVMMILAVILGIYTGILLSAFNARPLWNTSILGPLFLVSGFSTGLAATIWISTDPAERRILSRIDLVFIVVELFLIVHLFMGFLAGTETAVESAKLFLGGSFTMSFWVFVVILGLIFPGVLEAMELRGLHVPKWIPAALILFGGLMFRFIIVEAGQISRFLN
ncbi:MAG TPA: NrfD/PsrC family molybdoenzyme membrane anchor subunit [Bacteroidales bacterium]|nr:NrfD/PsrC family molybdoenzyme membrane anchor subunit [Bacteroidales bacterium]